jgi:MFS family permease
VVSATNLFLGLLYGDLYKANNHGRIFSSMAFAGTVTGMLLFGYLADRVGRKFGMMTCSVIVRWRDCAERHGLTEGRSLSLRRFPQAPTGLAGRSRACSLHSRRTASSSAWASVRWMPFHVVQLSLAVGGEYPAGSVAAAENSNELTKGRQHMFFALATNTMIDFGFVVSALVPLILVAIFGEDHLRVCWRMSLGLGCVPAAAVFIWRLRMCAAVPMRGSG